MIDDGALRELAGRQHGVVSVEQAIELGYSEGQRRRLVDGRRWERRKGRVYRLVGSTVTEKQRLMVEVLAHGPGAALAAETALAFLGVRGTALEPITVDRPRDRCDRKGNGRARAREPVLFPPDHVIQLDGIPVVVPARALFELAGSERAGARKPWWVAKVKRIMNNALTDLLVSGPSLHDMLRQLAQRGRPGIRVMRQVLAEVDERYVAPASGVESRVVEISERGGIEPLARQVDIGDHERWIGRVDFADARVPFVLEVQSERFHTSQLDRQLDRTRFQRLAVAGFVVRTVTDVDVWRRPDHVLAVIREGRAAAAALVVGEAALAA